jgi:hypothetical protein
MREKIRSMKSSYASRIMGSGAQGEAKLVTQTMLATSVTFMKALSTLLSNFYGELTNAENQTSGSEAWSLVCSIVRRMLDDIVVHRGQAGFVDFKNAEKQVTTEYLWASLYSHVVMAEYNTHEFRHHASIAPIINYHLYHHRVPWSVFNELQEEVTKVRLIANAARRWADRSTTAERGGGDADQ